MRIVISEDNNKLYRSELLAFDPSMEIIALNPLDSGIQLGKLFLNQMLYLCAINSYLQLGITQKFTMLY